MMFIFHRRYFSNNIIKFFETNLNLLINTNIIELNLT